MNNYFGNKNEIFYNKHRKRSIRNGTITGYGTNELKSTIENKTSKKQEKIMDGYLHRAEAVIIDRVSCSNELKAKNLQDDDKHFCARLVQNHLGPRGVCSVSNEFIKNKKNFFNRLLSFFFFIICRVMEVPRSPFMITMIIIRFIWSEFYRK